MQKPLSIALIIIHLFGNTELNQLIKLPRLVSHYYQHHRINHNINFIDFLVMHYGGDDGTSSDNDVDAQLPFHHANSHCLFMAYYPMAQAIVASKAMEYEGSDYGVLFITDNPSKHVLLILQPPRIT